MKTFHISIPTPCHEDWNKMSAKEQGRFCDKCSKTVLDFSIKTPDEIQQYFHEHDHEKLCGRFSNDQIKKPALVEISFRDLSFNMNPARIFLVSLLLVFGTSLFSCTTPDNEIVGKVVLRDINIPQETDSTADVSFINNYIIRA